MASITNDMMLIILILLKIYSTCFFTSGFLTSYAFDSRWTSTHD